jgi:hypothetical protein
LQDDVALQTQIDTSTRCTQNAPRRLGLGASFDCMNKSAPSEEETPNDYIVVVIPNAFRICFFLIH